MYEINRPLVLMHLLRDVAELIGAYGQPDSTCETWLRTVLTDPVAADAALFGES